MARAHDLLDGIPDMRDRTPRGEVELIANAEHFHKVVRGGMLKAQFSIDIATADFKAMLVPEPRTRKAPSIVDVFRTLAKRGVEVRILHSGVPSSPVLRTLREELPDRIVIRRCPRVHMKVVLIDSQRLYLGSANLTGAGLGAKGAHRRNFEMGVWTRSPELIDGAMGEFNALWEGQQCVKCQRKNVCPVPLEEPDLS